MRRCSEGSADADVVFWLEVRAIFSNRRVPEVEVIERDGVFVGDGPAAIVSDNLVELDAAGYHPSLRAIRQCISSFELKPRT